jgi:hypothetical protein
MQEAPLQATGRGDEIDNTYPGQEVEIDWGSGTIKVMVFPAGVSQIKKFSRALAYLVKELTSTPLVKDDEGKYTLASLERLVPVITDLLVTDLLDLVLECCKPKLDFKHWHIPQLTVAWLIENFGEEKKLRPWVQAVERMIYQTTGERVQLWQTLRENFTPAATRAMTSLRDNISSQAESPTHTSDGLSPSSSTPPESRPEPISESEPPDSGT